MITLSIIQKSQLEWENRIDAECYKPEYLQMEKALARFKCEEIVGLSKSVINFGAYSLCNYITFLETGVPFLVTEDIDNNLIDDKNLHYVAKEVHQILHKSHCKKNQVLLTMAGAYLGQAAVYDFDFVSSSNQAIAKITIKDENINPYFLSTFLVSKYGQFQIERLKTVTGQPNINLGQIKKIKVPILENNFQKSLGNIIALAKSSLIESDNLMTGAEKLLLEELGLAGFKPREDLSFVTNLSEVIEANRVDADSFQPKYEELVSRLKPKNAKPFTEAVQNVAARFSSKPNENYRYVELANIDSSIGIIDGYSEVLGKEAPSRAKRILKTGDVIVSSVEGSLEKVALVSEDQESYLASTGFFQFRSEEILPEALLVLAKSIVLQMQLKQHCAGTILTAVPKESLEKMLIPVLPKETQEKIADLVRRSHEARKKSKQLLEEAKRKVEEMIEKGGEN